MKPSKQSSYTFDGDEGTFVSAPEAEKRTDRYKKTKNRERGTYTEAQFFGSKKLQKLLSKEGCVGLRFYFADGGEGDVSEQLVVVAVDRNGRDLIQGANFGLKDMPERDEALADGPRCPSQC